MAPQKLYAGTTLRELRGRVGLTQKAFAAKLGVSLPYLNQMENNHRPISAGVVLALAQEFGFDVTGLSTGDNARLVSDMREALADPVFGTGTPPLADLRLAASNAPALARAFLDLHRAYRQNHERLASLDEALGRDDSALRPSPWEEVRDFFHYCDNYLDAVDRAAEHFAIEDGARRDPLVIATEALGARAITPGLRRCADAAGLRSCQTLDIHLHPRDRTDAALPVAASDRPADTERSAGGDAGPRPLPDARGEGYREDRAGQLLRRSGASALSRLPARRTGNTA